MIKQGLELKQTQKLSPLQIQTIKLIELPIQELEQRIQAFYQSSQEDLNKKEQELIQPINEKLVAAVKAVGDEQGLVYIFDISTPSTLMYYSPSKCQDVTAAIRTKLGLK